MHYNVEVMKENYLPNIIGQAELKQRLDIYRRSFEQQNKLPFLIFTGGKGNGKTKLIREFRQTLRKNNGDTPPIMEVNGAAVKSAESFLQSYYPHWINNNAVLFIDEAHNIPSELQELFLTILEKDPNPVRRITYTHREEGEVDYEFDFRKISIVFATTDQQKLKKALLDRLTKISIQPYSTKNLFDIFQLNCKTRTSDEISGDIVKVFRGHPRACVELAEELDHFASAKGVTYINKPLWDEFCLIMGIYQYGLNDAELKIIKLLGERQKQSLNAIAASTGFSRSVIQNEYEAALLGKGLIDIDGKRMLTKLGRELYLSITNPTKDVEQEVVEDKTTKEKPVQEIVERVKEVAAYNPPTSLDLEQNPLFQ